MKIMFTVMLSYHMNASTAKSLPENVIGYSEQMNSFKIKYETLLNLIGLLEMVFELRSTRIEHQHYV